MRTKRRGGCGSRILGLLLFLVLVGACVYAYTHVPQVRGACETAVEYLGGAKDFLLDKLGVGKFRQSEDWRLVLVNFETPVDESFSVETAESADGYLFDARAVAALDQMLADGRAQGLALELTSAYRTETYQAGLFENKVSRVMDEQGCPRSEAEDVAAQEVARPGRSEHQTGLAADIVCTYYSIMDAGYANTPEAVWLKANCARYGFILRYPEEKSAQTGVIFEPWHFRYVGGEAAAYIMEKGLCLEEYLGEQR